MVRQKITSEEYESYEYSNFRIEFNTKGFLWLQDGVPENEEGYGALFDCPNIAQFTDGNNNVYCVPIYCDQMNFYTIGELAEQIEEGSIVQADFITDDMLIRTIKYYEETGSTRNEAIKNLQSMLNKAGILINVTERIK